MLLDGYILVPLRSIFRGGRLEEGLRKMTSSVLAVLSEILLASSHLNRPLRSLLILDSRDLILLSITSRLVSSANL